MTSDRWRQIERLYHEALAHDEAGRAEFLREACGGDEPLRREVDSLLAQDQSEFLAKPAVDIAAGLRLADALDEARAEEPMPAETLPIWARALIAIAAVRTAIALILYLSAGEAPLPIASGAPHPPLPPLWIYAALSGTFTALGLGLVVGSRHDARAEWLGGYLTLTAAPLATLLMQATVIVPPRWLVYVRPEALGAAMLWHFLARFPSDLGFRAGRVVRSVATATAIAGLWCFAANLAAVLVPSSAASPWVSRFLIGPGTLYWLVISGTTAPAFPVLFWRALVATGAARRRVRLFGLGLLAGVAPFALEVLVEETVPAYKVWAYGPSVAPWIGALIFGALAIVPFVTAYSVLFDHVVEVRVVLRAAVQYVLARYTIVGATLVPFAALAVFLVQHREESIVSLMTGQRPVLLGSFAAIGMMSLRLRSSWLDSLDRRYFRESYDAHDILARVVGELQGATAGELADGIRQEMARALHADAEVFLADEPRTALRHADERLPPIALASKLVDLALADPRPMDVDLEHPKSLLSRLPEEERHWLRRGNFSLLIALRRASGGVEGVLALTPKRSGLPFSDDDRRLLSAVASAASLAFDSLRLRSTPATPVDRPARECLECSRLSSFETARCECGGDLAIAKVPHVLRGVFRFEQRIGAGGMGVVYKAVDLSLGRDVAIKALPRVTPELVARLRREARAMAAVTHTNLAVIHSVETWQGTPFLVQEYLAGGTLAQRLAAARPAIGDVLDLGVTLAGLLQHMHASGVVHCDIKPSNIGFTQQGIVKLLDFGLARVMRDARAATGPTPATREGGDSAGIPGDAGGGWFGTPYFMSPEAARGEPPAPSFDLWALAVVLYEAIAGCRPFEGQDAFEILARITTGPAPDIREARPDVSEALAGFFEAALAQDPARRPPDASAFGAALRRLRDRVA